jgi:imidazole glycerol-phosphate synthase subunit HisF
VDAFEWAQRAVELGAGELLVTSIDQDGTGKGYDLTLTKTIAQAVSVPVIALGGAGNTDHVSQVVVEGWADAVSLASMLHYDFIQQYQYREGDYNLEGNIEFLQGLRGQRSRRSISAANITEIKEFLLSQGVECRLQEGVVDVQ